MVSSHVSSREYGSVATTLHWTIAASLVVQFAIAWSMPDIGPHTQPGTLIELHLSFGAFILLLVIVRLAWRLMTPVPPPVEGMPKWQRIAARASHAILYALLAILPVLGWASASGRGFPVRLLGLIPLPPIVSVRSRWTGPLGDAHATLAYVLLGFIAVHVAAALYHHFILRDGTLARMLPIAAVKSK